MVISYTNCFVLVRVLKPFRLEKCLPQASRIWKGPPDWAKMPFVFSSYQNRATHVNTTIKLSRENCVMKKKKNVRNYKACVIGTVKFNREGDYFINMGTSVEAGSRVFCPCIVKPGDKWCSQTVCSENKSRFLSSETLLFSEGFSCCGTLVGFSPRGRGQR